MKLWLLTEGQFFHEHSTLFEDEPLLVIRAATEADAIAMGNEAMTRGLTRSISFIATELNPDGIAEVIYAVRGWEYSED